MIKKGVDDKIMVLWC